MRRARGEFIAFMDSDDFWLPTKLELQVAALRRRAQCAWSQTSFTLADATGRAIRAMPAADGWIMGQLAGSQTVVALPSVMAYRVLLEDAGGFDEELITCEDYDLWLRLAARSEVAAISEPLTVVRRHHEHYSDPITAYNDSIWVIDKLLRSNIAPEFAPVVRRMRAKWCARLARTYVDSGNRAAAARVLRSSAATSWRYWHWWRGGLAAILQCFVPIAARRFARKVCGGPA
jgi:glycosyltransferase involved in cell wall biosynthesis